MAAQKLVLVVNDGTSHRLEHRELTSGLESGASLLIGRGWHCDVVIQDSQVDAEHLRLTLGEDGQLRCADLNSLNGVRVAGTAPLLGEQDLASGAEIKLGKSRLKVFSSDHPVPAATHPSRWDALREVLERPWWPLAAMLALFGLQVLNKFAGTTTPIEADDLVSALFSTMTTLGVWVLFWGVLSKLMRNAMNLRAHLAIAATTGVVAWFIQALAAWAGWQTLSLDVSQFVLNIGTAALLFVVAALTLGIATRLRRRSLVLLAALPPLLLLGSVYLLPLLRDEPRQWGPEIVTGSFPPGWALSQGLGRR